MESNKNETSPDDYGKGSSEYYSGIVTTFENKPIVDIYSLNKIQNTAINALALNGVVSTVNSTVNKYENVNDRGLTGRDAAKDSVLVDIVAEDTRRQREALNEPLDFKDDGKKYTIIKTKSAADFRREALGEPVIQQASTQAKQDVVAAPLSSPSTQPGQSGGANNFTQGNITINLTVPQGQSYGAPVTPSSPHNPADNAIHQGSPVVPSSGGAGVPPQGPQPSPTIQSAAQPGNQPQAPDTQGGVQPNSPEGVQAPEVSKAGPDSAQEEIKKLREQVASLEATQIKIYEALNKKKESSVEKLKNMGLTGVSKGLEGWKNARWQYKVALAVSLAGLSVATGGLTSIIPKAFTAMTYTSMFLERAKKKHAESEEGKNGEPFNQGRQVWRAALLGVATAIATTVVVGEIASHIDGVALMESAGEKFSAAKESVKGFLSSLFGTTPDVPGIATAFQDPNPENIFAIGAAGPDGALATFPGDLSAQGSASISPDGWGDSVGASLFTAEYPIQTGDNLTNIIKERVLSHIPGAENLTALQKDNMIAHYFELAAEHVNDDPGVGDFHSVNQFYNPAEDQDPYRVIQPGKILNLEKIREVMSTAKLPGGETLLEHAKALKP